MSCTQAAFLAEGRKHEGARESANNVNPFTKWLHAHGYRSVNGEYWCADYEAYLDYVTGNDVPSHSAATYVSAAAYKKAGRWSTNPKIGAKTFFYDPAEGRIGHEGHVVSYTASTVTVQAGNTSGAGSRNGDRVATKVFRRHASSGFRIVGYGLPKFKAGPAAPPKPKAKGNINRVLHKGNAGSDVTRVQKLVGTKADGVFGPKTAAAVKVWQGKHHLAKDGEFGPKCCHTAGWTFGGKRV